MSASQASETAAAFVATVRDDHERMTVWYNAARSRHTAHAPAHAALKERFGAVYPGVWKEVLNWPGWHETRQLYLQDCNSDDRNNNGSHADAVAEAPTRKRKSRWGNTEEAPPPTNSTYAPSTINNNNNRNSTSRFGTAPAAHFNGPNTTNNNNNAQVAQWQAELRQLNQRMERIPTEAVRVDALPRNHRDRSPSPPPIYGPDGKRQNTRAVRWRERYTAQRQELLEKLLQHTASNSTMGALLSGGMGAGMNGPNGSLALLRPSKTTKKIPIPLDKHPNYNFIGLIIGPRGKTQKELEAKTGCKIAIRGKGSVKEGARGRRDGVQETGDYEPLHVVVSGDDPRAVEAAVTMITDMLVVIDDERNVHKQQQLRELALLNGTLKDDDAVTFCPVCGEKGHRAFECPKRLNPRGNRPGGSSGGPGIKCAICGDTGHPTRDCKQARPLPGGIQANAATGEGVDALQVDSDYQSFMAELDGSATSTKAPPPVSSLPAAVTAAAPNQPPVDVARPPLPPVSLPPPPPPGIEGSLPPPPPPPPPLYQSAYPSDQRCPGGSAPPPYHGQPPQPPYYGQHQQNYHQQQQQQHPNNQYPYQAGGQDGYGRPDSGNNGQQQQAGYQQVAPGEETAAWNPDLYGGGGNAAGAFNWWEQ